MTEKIETRKDPGWILWLDVARVIALIMISLNHAQNRAMLLWDRLEASKKIGVDVSLVFSVLIYLLSRLGVPLFLMISGALLLKKSFESKEDISRFYRNNWSKIFITTEIWLVIMYFCIINAPYDWPYPALTNGGEKFVFLIRTMFFDSTYTYGNLWYMRYILLIYMVIPIVAIAIRKLSDRVMLLPLGLLVTIGFVAPFIKEAATLMGHGDIYRLSLNAGQIFSLYMVYLFAGYWISQGKLAKISGKLLGGITALLSAFVIYYVFLYSKTGYYGDIAYEHILILSLSVLVFEWVRRLGGRISRPCAWLSFLADSCFAVYFLHIIIMEQIWYVMIGKYKLLGNSVWLTLAVLEIFSVGLSICVIYVLSHIGFIRKYVFMMKTNGSAMVGGLSLKGSVKRWMQPQAWKESVYRLPNILLYMYAVLLLMNVLPFGKYWSSQIHWAQFALGIVWLAVLAARVWLESPKGRLAWVKQSGLTLLYLGFGATSVALHGFRYSDIRTGFVELIYLLLMTGYLCDGKWIKQRLFPLLIYTNLVANIASLIAFILLKSTRNDRNLIHFFDFFSYIREAKVSAASIFYANPNSMGLMTGMALLLVLIGFRKGKALKHQILQGLYIVLSLYSIWKSGSRSTQMGFLVAALVLAGVKLAKWRIGKKVSLGVFWAMALGSLAMLMVSFANRQTGMTNLSAPEKQVAKLTSDRYVIWKSTLLSGMDDLWLGNGSAKQVIETRDRFLDENYPDYYSYKKDLPKGKVSQKQQIKGLDLHNGYLTILFCRGLIGFVLFIGVITQRIIRGRYLQAGYWFVPLIFGFMINVFESSWTLDRYFLTLWMLLLLIVAETQKTAVMTTEQDE